MYDKRVALIQEYEVKKPEGVKVWDFGGSVTVMPVIDHGSGSYLTSTLCILYVEGADKKALEGKFLPRQNGEVADYGGGWKFFGVEFQPTTTVDELRERLDKAIEKLLGR